MLPAVLATPHDPAKAWAKFWFIAGGLVIGTLLVRIPSRVRRGTLDVPLLRLVVLCVPFALAVYFLVTNDWAAPVQKLELLQPLRKWLAFWQPDLPWWRVHPNVVGGLLAMTLPLQVAALAQRRAWPLRGVSERIEGAVGLAMLVISALALVLSGLRGAWLALGVAVVLRLFARWTRALRVRCTTSPLLAGVSLGASLVIGAWATLLLWNAVAVLRMDRLLVWGHSWELAWDYFFTGLGLGNFAMPYSSYALLVHVPHTDHAHNLFLDIWLEHGLLGLISFVWLVYTALLSGIYNGPAAGWRVPALVALTVVLLHGLIDDVYYGYQGVGATFLFVPMGLLWREAPRRTHSAMPSPRWWSWVILFASLFVVAAGVRLHALRSLIEANAAAVFQTRLELSGYRWPRWAVQDAWRRAESEQLSRAISYYHLSLLENPRNETANRRLGQIELSMGEYQLARVHLSAAYLAARCSLSTRQLYGESLAVTGAVREAAAVWSQLRLEQDQLEIRREWYRSLGESRQVRWIDEAMSLRHVAGRVSQPPFPC